MLKYRTRDDENKQKKKSPAVVSSSCETCYVNKYYDVNTFSLTVKTVVSSDLKENIFAQKDFKSSLIDLSKESPKFVHIYKLITVTVNSTLLGWICEHIKNTMKNMLIKFQEKIIESYDKWKNISEEELVELEKKMIETFMKTE